MGKIDVGGQAVIEGIMIKSPNYYAISVRKPNGKISTTVKKHVSITKRIKILGWPVIRGVAVLIEMLKLGLDALTYSANETLEGEDEKISSSNMIITVVISVLFALGLFVFLPLFLTNLIVEKNNFLFNLIDGIIRIFFFFVYILLISFFKDVKVLFAYHGAEHAVIHAYEKGVKLEPKNINRNETLHQRCGTAFIFVVLILSIIIFSIVPAPNAWTKIGVRIIFLPIIAGLSYELIKASAKHPKNILLKIFIIPGLLMQKITTKKPTLKQTEVAIVCLKAVLKKEKAI